MIRVGLIGFGLAGQAFHAPMIRGVPGLELACILERHTSNAQKRYPQVKVARSLDELLSDKTIQLCVVATPNDSHFQLTRDCLLAGRDVVVDKPFTPTMAEAEQLCCLAAERKRLLTVYQDRRWDGAFMTVRKIIGSGELGDVAEYEARFDRFRLGSKPGAWREPIRPLPACSGTSVHTCLMARWFYSENRRASLPQLFASVLRRRWMTPSTCGWNIRGCAPACAPASLPTLPAIICWFMARRDRS
jgi:predicted dehydrogenase